MKNTFACVIVAAALAACGSKPVPPQWQANAYSSVTSFTTAYLRGESSVADTEFARARSEMASTGRPDLVAKVELVRCAAQVAALDIGGCPGYRALEQDASAEERAYAAYIAGRFSDVNVAALPEQHRPVVATGSIAGVADPLGRLVAAGALLQAGRITPTDIKLAVDTASEQGWRRPLLAWLGVQLKRAQAAGDTTAAALIQRRIDLAGASP
ncbi:hypothetical protein E4L96_05875 [Massilia arenosa]|uniref:Lipoprotein n=1 Tax=Zemynaea arenosa TaxID=2561931 RepID=A0A4Y9SHQ8_9BURK|nr:hypothetical protein [Massilia arenosa]TFW24692.1 hypothetical protein E4L96_05875 [Massilia arenosa]